MKTTTMRITTMLLAITTLVMVTLWASYRLDDNPHPLSVQDSIFVNASKIDAELEVKIGGAMVRQDWGQALKYNHKRIVLWQTVLTQLHEPKS